MIMFLQPKADLMNEDILYGIKIFKKQTTLPYLSANFTAFCNYLIYNLEL